MLIASITDPIVEVATDVVAELGLLGIFVLMMLESACIPVPSEATMLFAGFNVSDGEYSLFAAVAVGSVANLVGSWIAYGVGYYGRVDVLEKHGKKLHIKKSHLAWADRWFERHGDATVFFTRMLPIIRTFISLPAGVARMPFWRFSAADARRLRAVGADAHLHRQAGGRQLGEVEGLAALRRLRNRRGNRRRRSSTSSYAAGAAGHPAIRPPRPHSATHRPQRWRSARIAPTVGATPWRSRTRSLGWPNRVP